MSEDLTSKFKEAEKEAKCIYKVKGFVHDLHGQYETRVQTLTRVVYSHMDTEETEKRETESEKKRTTMQRARQVEVRTFPKNEKGQFVAPLGGDRGYLKGMFKTAAKLKFGDSWRKRTSKYYGLKSKIVDGVFIQPEWIELGNKLGNPSDQPKGYLIQRVGTTEYYDYINKAPFEVDLVVEGDVPEEVILHTLATMQRLGCGPKRRGRIEITNVERLKT